MKISVNLAVKGSAGVCSDDVRQFLLNRGISSFRASAGYVPNKLVGFVEYAVIVDHHVYTQWCDIRWLKVCDIRWLKVVVFFADDERWILRNDEDCHEVLLADYDELNDIPF